MQNDMRNRLANLICEAERKVNNEYPTIEMVADHLIANGVIVPPCKVGDTVYYFCTTFGTVLPYFVETLNIGYYDKNKVCYQYEANCHNNGEDELIDGIDFEPDDIGKTVFLTKEQAEQKLRELNK